LCAQVWPVDIENIPPQNPSALGMLHMIYTLDWLYMPNKNGSNRSGS
jgi:hypothetical protein